MNDKYIYVINMILMLMLVIISADCFSYSRPFRETVLTYIHMEKGAYPDSLNLEQMVQEEKKRAALTFDDGPSPLYTEKLLDGLKERDVKATFFVIGNSVEGNEDILKRMIEEGHIIGNHTYSHVQLSTVSYEVGLNEIEETNNIIFNACGVMPEYIRPPYGSWNDKMTMDVNMTEVLWNVDPLDWQTSDSELVVKRVLKCVDDGSIILLHDVYKSSVDAALKIVDELKKEGYEFVTIDELLLD